MFCVSIRLFYCFKIRCSSHSFARCSATDGAINVWVWAYYFFLPIQHMVVAQCAHMYIHVGKCIHFMRVDYLQWESDWHYIEREKEKRTTIYREQRLFFYHNRLVSQFSNSDTFFIIFSYGHTHTQSPNNDREVKWRKKNHLPMYRLRAMTDNSWKNQD